MNRQPTRLNIFLIDSDPVFRQGLITCLSPYPDLQVVLEADSQQTVLQTLQTWFNQRFFNQREADSGEENESRSLDLVLLSLDLERTGLGQTPALNLCQQITEQYSSLPVLAISVLSEPEMLAAALQSGANGYCQKGSAIADWVTAIRQVAAGDSYWQQDRQPLVSATSVLTTTPPGPLAVLRRNVRASGVRQIDAAIAELNTQLNYSNLPVLDQLLLAGRQRELKAARWLVNRLLKPPQPARLTDPAIARPVSPSYPSTPVPRLVETDPSTAVPTAVPTTDPAAGSGTPEAIILQPASDNRLRSLQASLFDTTFAKLQFPLTNLTNSPLEIDILREDRKRELLSLILRKLEEVLDDLRVSQVAPEQLPDKQATILLNLWQATTTDYFGRYYTLPVGNSPTENLRQPAIEIVEVLLEDREIVQSEILNKIPLITDFLAYLLFQTPLMVDNTAYAVGTVESMIRVEALLQNLTIETANAVIQPLLNRFGDVVAIKQNFYDRRLLSTREIERFRNNLSWKYRVEKYFREPTAIFESRYMLFVLQELGITKTSIYFPRNQELETLGGVRLAVTLALEARDAVSPRLRSAVSFVGSGMVYMLTEVIGRGIGLIGRGIIKGVGNALQDTKFSRR